MAARTGILECVWANGDNGLRECRALRGAGSGRVGDQGLGMGLGRWRVYVVG